MRVTVIRFRFISDTHLGIDSPGRPRVKRRRRGDDFFRIFREILADTRQAKPDFLVHGGDLFYRSRIPAALVQSVFQPLMEIAESGIPVFIVPGNHERSRIPYPLLTRHPRIHIFHRPATCVRDIRGVRVALTGFPFERGNIRRDFARILAAARWRESPADLRFLCMHQAVDGATVGPADFMFRNRSDVVDPRRIPRDFLAVLAGHIHRAQVLRRDIAGYPLPAPVFMAGSIDRTSFAERFEAKGFFDFQCVPAPEGGWKLLSEFVKIPVRPMAVHDLEFHGASPAQLENRIRDAVARYPADAILRLALRLPGNFPADGLPSAARLRELAPETMNISLVRPGKERFR